MVDVGERLRKIRKAVRLTQKEVAQKVHMTQSYIAGIENNTHNPSLSALQMIADVLHVDIAELVGNEVTNQDTGLSDDEAHLITMYRSLSDKKKTLTISMVSELLPPKARYSTSTSSPTIRTRKVAMGG